jgi:hypothetical protein
MRATITLCLMLAGCSESKSDPRAVDAGEEDAEIKPPPVELGRHSVAIIDTRQVIPGPGLPAEAPPQNSNNNLDVVRHDGRVYLAWRTGPDHYASDKTALYVISSADEKTWTFEHKVTAGLDLREPRFLSFSTSGGNGSLFLYLARLGNDPNRFEPKGMSYVEKTASGWGALTDFGAPTFIPWRARIERGKPYLVAYDHGEQIYAPAGIPIGIHLFTTTDGRTWSDLDPSIGAVSTGGGSETDFAIGDDGTLFAVTRNEAGDKELGFGSKVCRAAASNLAKWTCKSDPKKYDSPLMFWHDGEAYLIGRRHLSPTGNYDLEEIRDRPFGERWFKNQVDYKVWPKRCSLWRYVQSEDRIAFILDLPSRGDTCFPAKISGANADELVVYNYSSPIDGPDLPWNEGQLGETRIYRHVLKFSTR